MSDDDGTDNGNDDDDHYNVDDDDDDKEKGSGSESVVPGLSAHFSLWSVRTFFFLLAKISGLMVHISSSYSSCSLW